jgi:tetratricopeptide (TPR) repeat protein
MKMLLRTGYFLVALLTLSGCSSYRVTVQGVPLDHFIESRTVSSDSLSAKREAAYHNDLGVLLEREGDLTGALEQYRIARKQDPELVLAYINAGNVNVKLEQLTEAEDLYRQALNRDPDQPEALNNLAWVHILRGENLTEAITLLEHAIRADQENRYRYLDSLGWAMQIDGRTEEALEILKTALAETPPEEKYLLGETHYHLGLIYHGEAKSDLAEEHFRKSLDIYPSLEREKEIENLAPSAQSSKVP